jgi:hypothetical protein
MLSTNSPTLCWAIVRILLGVVQMAGAVATLVLLIRFGQARETMIALCATMAVTVISIFRREVRS